MLRFSGHVSGERLRLGRRRVALRAMDVAGHAFNKRRLHRTVR